MKSIILVLLLFTLSLDLEAGQTGTQSSSSATPTAGTAAQAQSADSQKKKRPLRIGVAPITSIVSDSLETDGWQQELVNDINFLGGQGVILSSDPSDREATMAEAKERNCDYTVFTKVINFKSVGVGEKIGSVLGHGGLGGVGGSGQGRVEISADVKVFQPDNVIAVLDGTDDFRQNDPAATSRGLLHTEARDIMLRLKKLQSAK